ncbi:ankyrin repeat-containing domain protein [Aspergillus floccosus]
MRLLDTTELKTKEFFDDSLPEYAILSHTWGEEEVSYQDLKNGDYAHMKGYTKIKGCCQFARARNIAWVWIDTCCIDKTSSAELTEAINSMYRWYQEATVCYAFLEDVPTRLFPQSRWFTRGWTLQELIAPNTVLFLNRDWEEIGTRDTLQREISECTGIPAEILSGSEDLGALSVAQRMSWASRRQTSRIEDRAYSMLGIFGINMPLIYGEGERAFVRLQEEIIRTSEDYTIFAWKDSKSYGGLLAPSPDAFADSASFVQAYHPAFATKATWAMSNRGLQVMLPFMGIGPGKLGLAALNCTKAGKETQLLAIYLRDTSGTMQKLERVLCDTLETVHQDNVCPSRFPSRPICVPQPRRSMRKWCPYHQGDNSQCLETLRTIFAPSNFGNMDMDFFQKLGVSTQAYHHRSFPQESIHLQLLRASRKGNIEDLRTLLVSLAVDVNCSDYEDRTALKAAASAGHTHAAFLLMCRPDIIVASDAPCEPLCIAVAHGHCDMVWLLLSRGDINIQIDMDKILIPEPRKYTAASVHKDIVRMFLARDDFDWKRLGSAANIMCLMAMNGDEPTVGMLLSRLNLRKHNLWTLEEYAARNGHEGIVKLLIARGAVTNEPLSDSMLEIAAEYGQKTVVRLLLDNISDLTHAEKALNRAAIQGHVNVVRLLIDHGVGIESRDDRGQTPLHSVVKQILLGTDGRHERIGAMHEIARILLSRGANQIPHPIKVTASIVPDINKTDESGRTLLSWAAEHGHDAIVEVLMRHGADSSVKDNRGRTALDLAQERGHSVVIQLLQRRMDTAKHSGNGTPNWSNKFKWR